MICRRVLIFFCLISNVILTGCSAVEVQDINTYAITGCCGMQMTAEGKLWRGAPKNAASSLVLEVARPTADPGYQSSRMIYMSVPYHIESFRLNRWLASPRLLLLPLLAQAIREQHYFRSVITEPSLYLAKRDYQLRMNIIMLRQEFLAPKSFIRFVTQVTLVDYHKGNGHIVATRQFKVLVKAAHDNPYSGVLATNKAATIMVRKIARFVVATLLHQQDKSS